jgi:hypothetical protein
MANDDLASSRNPDVDVVAKSTEEGGTGRSETRAEIRALILETVGGALVPRTEVDYLAENPRALATALVETEQMTRYLTYGVAFLAFVIWLMLQSRR